MIKEWFIRKREGEKQSLGARGEEMAARYLKKMGYAIIRRNYRCKSGEIDIVAERRGTLVIAEVKTRRSRRFGAGIESVGPRKQRRIVRATKFYLATERVEAKEIRFDVLSVDWENGQPMVQHFPAAFEAEADW